jgi:protein-L-isoaspartate(D-aspartate) O-methyltransferase
MSGDAPRAKRFPAQWTSGSRAAAPSGTSRNPLRPQALLHQAAQDAARHVVPTGLGLDNGPMRERMVARLRSEGIRTPALLAAFGAVARHRFVDTALAIQAYEDTSLPIGLGQTISKPSVVARQLQWLFDGANASAQGHLGRTLEIGTGCGYQTALLALMSARVLSVERLKPLHEKARLNLDDRRPGDVRLVWGDGRIGHAPNAPYDSIVAAAGGDDLPPAWTDQLAEGGRLVAPVHDAGAGGQMLLVVDRRDGALRRQLLDAVHFVPLKSGTA